MTWLGKILAILNVLAAAGFAYLALLDHSKRAAATAAVREHDLAAQGLPIQEQYNDPSQPRERYVMDQPDAADSDSLKARFQASGAGQPVPVQTDEVKRVQKEFLAKVNQAAEDFIKDSKDKAKAVEAILFPLATSGEQLADFQKRLKAAKTPDQLDKLLLEAAKRAMLAQALLPLEELRPRGRREVLAASIGDLNKPVSLLESLVETRFAEALRPVAQDESAAAKKDDKDKKAGPVTTGLMFELVTSNASSFRMRYNRFPKDQRVSVALIGRDGKETSAGDNVKITLTNVEGRPEIELNKDGGSYSGKAEAFGKDAVLAGTIDLTVSGKAERCLFIEREPMDQRQAIAYLLVTLGQVTRPDGKALLETLGEKRIEVVVGRDRFNRALEMQTLLLRQIADRRLPVIEADRAAFVDQYRRELYLRLPYLIAALKRHQAILKQWDDQLEKHESQKRDRKKFRDQILVRVQAERKRARDALAELLKFQEALFQAQAAGSGVAEENQRLEKQIRVLEMGR